MLDSRPNTARISRRFKALRAEDGSVTPSLYPETPRYTRWGPGCTIGSRPGPDFPAGPSARALPLQIRDAGIDHPEQGMSLATSIGASAGDASIARNHSAKGPAKEGPL